MEVELPPGDEPLVLIAPSTSQDPEHTLVRAAVEGLADLPVRVLAATGRPVDRPLRVPANARVVEWVSYGRTMPRCDVVVCHGGHGTLARALASGAAVVVCPEAGDMNENAARVDWAGVGVRLPRRLLGPGTLRLAVQRALDEPGLRERAGEFARWYEGADPAGRAAELVEQFAAAPVPAAVARSRSGAIGASRDCRRVGNRDVRSFPWSLRSPGPWRASGAGDSEPALPAFAE